MDELRRPDRPDIPETGSAASEIIEDPNDPLRADAMCPNMRMAPSAFRA